MLLICMFEYKSRLDRTGYVLEVFFYLAHKLGIGHKFGAVVSNTRKMCIVALLQEYGVSVAFKKRYLIIL
jgi:hypothetical protein